VLVSRAAPTRSIGRLARLARQGQHPADDEQGDEPDRHVEVEDPAPAVDAEQGLLAGEAAAEHRAEDAARAEHRHEPPLVATALPRRHEVADDREGERHEAAGAQPLHRAVGRELVDRAGEAAQDRAHEEDDDRGQVERLAAVLVGQLAVERRRDRRGDEVRRRHPRLRGLAVELVRDGAHRRRDDRLVERGEEHAEQQPGQHDEDLPVGQGAGGGSRPGGR
jgi:hypothetical protein